LQRKEATDEKSACEADDNTALILDHGNAVYSVIQTGFVYVAQRDAKTGQRVQITSTFPWPMLKEGVEAVVAGAVG
jgi:hypothetical protein